MKYKLKAAIAKEVKEEILAKVKAGVPAQELAQTYGISPKTIYGWLRWNSTNKVTWLEHVKLKKENQQLKEIIGILTLEVEKSKKREVRHIIEDRVKGLTKTFLSRLFNVSRRNLYQSNTLQAQKDMLLKDQVLKVLEINPSYGHRRIDIELGVGKKRTRRVMKLFGIKPYKRKARWKKPQDLSSPPAPYPNLAKGLCPIKPNVVFAGDFTHLVWNGKVFYLATFIDIFTREIVGWSVSSKHTTELVIEAFLDAIKNVGLPKIVHTDQGSEYKAKDYTSFIENLGVQISMSAKASPWENGYQESFYDNFKTDLGLEFERFETIGEFIEAIHKTINYYNNDRIHTKLKTSPFKFKLKFLNLVV